SFRLESEVLTPVRNRAWSSAIATLIKELDSGFFMDYCISKTIGFGIYSIAARWKIPATYTIVEVLDFEFAESTSQETRDFLRN
ncbi:MAG TPA: hypothetical protein VJU78_18095, partial [Chitinophagaceae bacterium]|nr:hypothetical protein [Chitinophagaceae bacterium]